MQGLAERQEIRRTGYKEGCNETAGKRHILKPRFSNSVLLSELDTVVSVTFLNKLHIFTPENVPYCNEQYEFHRKKLVMQTLMKEKHFT